MKQIRLVAVVVFLVASSAFATVFQPVSDRQLADRSDAVVIATVRDASSRVRADGYVVTDYRLDVEKAIKGTAEETITVSEIGGVSGHRVIFISDSAAYAPGEQVMVFLRKRSDGTYFTTSMAMGKFSFTRNARGEAVVTRDVSELRDDPPRLADGFARFVSGARNERYSTTLTPLASAFHPRTLASPSSYCLFTTGVGSLPVRWKNGDIGRTVGVFTNSTMSYDTTSDIAAGCAAWTNDPAANISLVPSGTTTASTADGSNSIFVYLSTTTPNPPGICDGALACTAGYGGETHTFAGETFADIVGADIFVQSTVPASQFQTLITHELGHAIGFRHANDGTPFASSAIMASPVNAGLGASLQQWDIDAVETVYGSGPTCQPPASVAIFGGGAVTSGQSATLAASVTGGNSPFTYAWFDGFLNDTSHPVGSNSATFTTPPITGTKNYWVKVSNTCGNVTAQTTVFVQESTCTPPGISMQPVAETINSGGSATLTVGAGGSQPLTYQWYQGTSTADTTTPVGTNSPSFTTPALTQATSYWVKITNACGFANSNVAVVTIAGICAKPSFSIQPSGANVTAGSQTFLIAFANATSYQWYKGNAGDTSTPLSGLAPSNDRWINQVYVDLLGRPANAAEITAGESLLGGGGTRTTATMGVLLSTEYRQRLLTDIFSTFLRRAPSAPEISFWLPAFTAGLTDEQIEAQIVASPEYFALGGSTNAGWINRIFIDALGRVPSSAETAIDSTLLASSSRLSVGLSILTSNEAATRRVQQDFARFLRRNPSATDSAAFVSLIAGGLTNEQFISALLAADEYYNFGTVLFTGSVSATTSYWVRATNACSTADSAVATLSVPQCTAPVITGQPVSPSGNVGPSFSLSVIATGATAYQWYRASSGDPSNPVPGGTGPVLTVTPTNIGPTTYWVRVSNACGATNSVSATVTTTCGPRVLSLTAAPTAPSASTYSVSWNGDAALDFQYELQEATKADFSDAQTFTIAGATARAFTHTVTSDTRYYYRVHAAPLCGGDYGTYSQTGSVLVTAPQASTQPNFNLAQLPCTPPNCAITQKIFIPGIPQSGKTALDTSDTFTAGSDKPFITISPSSGPLPADGVTVTATIDMSGLDVGSTQASVTINRAQAAGKTGALSNPPPPITVPVSVSVVAPVTSKPKDPNAGFNALLIPAVAHADGIGSRFVSDVRLTNTAAQSITYQLTYTPNGTDGTVSGKQTNITVNAGDTKALNDIVKDWYGAGVLGEPPQGSLEIRPLNYAGKDAVNISFATVAASRTYSVAANGTFGQFIPALPLVNFLAKSDVSKISLQQVSQSSAAGGFRTNLGFIEGSGQPVDFVATLLDDAGHTVAERAYSLKPYESQQAKLDQFFSIPSIADGRVEVRVTSDTGHISAYASVLDNTTTDPLLVFPADPSKIAASRFVVPGVAEFDNSFSNFHTDMRIYNGGSSAVDVTLAFTGASVPDKIKTIGAGETLAIDNVLPTLWNTTGGGSVVATTANDAPLVVTARTYSRDKTNGGTFGQFIPGVTSSDAVGAGERALQIVQLEESPAFRTNLGLVEVTGNQATVELLAYTPDSKIAAKTSVPLNPGQYLQQGQIFKSLGFSNVYNGRITARVISGAGRVAAYGSVIDNRTTDPTYVPSQ